MDEKTRSQLQLDLAGTVVRPPTLIVSRSFKTSPALTPSNSPSCRRTSPSPSPGRRTSPPASRGSPTTKTPKLFLDPRKAGYFRRVSPFFPGRRLVPWVALVALWIFAVFHLQSNWSSMEELYANDEWQSSAYIHLSKAPDQSQVHQKATAREAKDARLSGEKKGDSESVGKKDNRNALHKQKLPESDSVSWLSSEEAEELRRGLEVFPDEQHQSRELPQGRSENNKTIGKLVGPFDQLEIAALGGEQSKGNCDAQSLFAKFVSQKSVVLVFHELSMTGAPLSMLELATKIGLCGGFVSAVVLNKAGGLYSVLEERGIFILKDKSDGSWNAAAKADLVVVGSASCAQWVGQYLSSNPKGADRLAWWVMENRREYFDRAKSLLGKVRVLIFLSELQYQTWRDWYSVDGSSLASDVHVVSLSVSDELATAAGLVNDTGNSMSGKLGELRRQVREQMGLDPDDLLLIALSSINSGKGQLLLVQAALMVAKGIEDEGLVGLAHLETDSALEERSRISRTFSGSRRFMSISKQSFSKKKQEGADDESGLEGSPKMRLLIGSVGSKSNKPAYVEKMVRILDQQPELARLVLSVPVTTHVASLYAAADAYVMNSQGIGETFGRVTIEAMAFGLPILATDAGGSREIVEANVTGLLHPTGRAGIPVLAQHIRWLLEHKEARQKMGQNGREKVGLLFREERMYEKLAKAFMRTGDGVSVDY